MNTKNAKKAELAGHHGGPEGPRDKWIQFIEPGKPACIAHNVELYVVTKNLGPSTVYATISSGNDEKLVPNEVRVIPVRGALTLECEVDKCATVELGFLPKSKL